MHPRGISVPLQVPFRRFDARFAGRSIGNQHDGQLTRERNQSLLEDWFWEADDLECTDLNNYYFTDTIVFEKEKAIGLKPIDSLIYLQEPFMIAIEGYESFIEYRYLFDRLAKLKYLKN